MVLNVGPPRHLFDVSHPHGFGFSSYPTQIVKPRIIITGIGLLLFTGIAIFCGTWLSAKKKARPLYGNFDVSMHCACGHDIFLDLESGTAYDNSPGHRDRKAIGSIVRTSNSAVIMDARDGAPWMRLDWDGSAHSLSFLKNPDSQSMMGMIPVRGRIRQVTNPWRTELPKYLPEN